MNSFRKKIDFCKFQVKNEVVNNKNTIILKLLLTINFVLEENYKKFFIK